MDLKDYLQNRSAQVDQALERWMPDEDVLPRSLHQAMRYSVFAGGKRLRPILMIAACESVGGHAGQVLHAACAMEMIHTYSLVHDDLPAMDDDDLRRGKPSCHKAFGEASAILAGDALQSLAFYVLSHDNHIEDARTRLRMLETLALAAGSRGMAGGQTIDLEAAGRQLDIAGLEYMHIHKTGALIRASVVLGALTAPELEEATLERLDHYAKCIGLAFQIRDDILDVEGETGTLGKRSGADHTLEKSTYPALIGLDASRQRAVELNEEAQDSLSGLGTEADPLRKISLYIVERDR